MTNSSPLKLIIFGGSGVLGSAIAEKFKAHNYKVTFGVRTITNPVDQFLLPITDGPVPELLKGELFDAVVFAQGANNMHRWLIAKLLVLIATLAHKSQKSVLT